MARHESDREDLMREATALVRRAELICPGETEPVIAGFRRDGRLALYFGPDPVFQFDPQHRLRRAYVAGFLYRTQGETLARLNRHRTQDQTLLVRHDLAPAELDTFRTAAKTSSRKIAKSLGPGRWCKSSPKSLRKTICCRIWKRPSHPFWTAICRSPRGFPANAEETSPQGGKSVRPLFLENPEKIAIDCMRVVLSYRFSNPFSKIPFPDPSLFRDN